MRVGAMYNALPLDVQEIVDAMVWDKRKEEIREEFLKELKWFHNEMWWYENTTPIPIITSL